MFLYGMRMMGDALQESSSGPLKRALEKLTSTPLRGFLLGLGITAIIQSSTATIVITSGLVGAGIISLHQSLGIIVGANVGTTVTGQIIRLLDLNAAGSTILQFFKPSTLAPLALIIGIIIIMGVKPKGAGSKVGEIIMGFGILFSGLLTMTDAVSVLQESGVIESMFSRLSSNPFLAYAIGAAVSFVLQSSSATVGILQAFSTSGQLTFSAIYSVLLGIYLGDCVTTAIVCNIGAKPDAKRVGTVNILFNFGKTLVILAGVTVLHATGVLNPLWNTVMYSGGIANTNTIFNLVSAILLFPLLGILEKISCRIIKGEPVPEEEDTSSELLDALSPVFFSTPAIAFGRCYDALLNMLEMTRDSISDAFGLLFKYDEEGARKVSDAEHKADMMADRISNYLVQLSGHVSAPNHIEILDHYYNIVNEFERLSDHAETIAEIAGSLSRSSGLPQAALDEISVLRTLLANILEYVDLTFRKRNEDAARHIEPLRQVVDEMLVVLKSRHMDRLRSGECTVAAGTEYEKLLGEVERIATSCSNIGIATIARIHPELRRQIHDYITRLHSGQDENFKRDLQNARQSYFGLLPQSPVRQPAGSPDGPVPPGDSGGSGE